MPGSIYHIYISEVKETVHRNSQGKVLSLHKLQVGVHAFQFMRTRGQRVDFANLALYNFSVLIL